jgi:hypothetical protein
MFYEVKMSKVISNRSIPDKPVKLSDILSSQFDPEEDKEERKKALKTVLDSMIYFVGIVGPAAVFINLFDFWVVGATRTLSLSWPIFVFFSPFWILYGIIHKKTPIIVTFSLWFLLGISMLLGPYIFG